MRFRAAIFATLVIASWTAGRGAGQPINCATVDAALNAALNAGYRGLSTNAYAQAAPGLSRAAVLFSACPRQTNREDEAMHRQVLAGVLWHIGERDASYRQLRALKSLNETAPFHIMISSQSANAFAGGDFRRGYELFRAALISPVYPDYVGLPVGLEDSGAATAIREALGDGTLGRYSLALTRANLALQDDRGSQTTRLVAGVANLSAGHVQRARDLLFDALLGFDANPDPHGRLTVMSLTAAYVLLALHDRPMAR